MGVLSWEFYSCRRGASISNFLRGVPTREAAHEKFTRMSIIPPRDLIEQYFSKGADAQDSDRIEADPSTVEATGPKQEGYDELIREIVEETTFDS